MLSRLHSPLLYSGTPLVWNATNPTTPQLVTRAVALRKGTDGWMHSLMARLPRTGLATDDATSEAYLDALSEVLSDGILTKQEAEFLARIAGSAGMGGAQVAALNQRFLDGLRVAALEDDALTPTEIKQLRAAAKTLGASSYFRDLKPIPSPQAAPSQSSHVNNGGSRKPGTSRRERMEQSLVMQRTGSSHAEIADALGVGPETVRSLLRDAKFYENPESDPSRLALAREALQSRSAGLTRDEFRSDRDLSKGKAAESWRDAAMLANLQ